MQAVFQESMRHIPQTYSQRLDRLENGEPPQQTVLHRFSRAASVSLDRLEQQAEESALPVAGDGRYAGGLRLQ